MFSVDDDFSPNNPQPAWPIFYDIPKLNLYLVTTSSTTTSASVIASTSLTSALSTAVAATTATFTWPGFIDYHIAAHEILAVEGLDNASSFLIVVDFHESEPTGLAAVAVLH
jgi:hypothetical protein